MMMWCNMLDNEECRYADAMECNANGYMKNCMYQSNNMLLSG